MASSPIEVKATDLGDYYGLFFFNGNTLRDNIRLVKPDYDEYNPRTWPLFNLAHIGNALGKTYAGAGPTLPSKVAYTSDVMELYLSKNPQHKVNNYPSHLFRLYPLNFHWEGSLRAELGISNSMYTSWLRALGRDPPISPLPRDAGESHRIQTASSGTAYEHVMRLLRDKEVGDSAAMDKIKVELADTQRQLSNEKAKAVTANGQVKHLRQRFEKARQELTTQTEKANTAGKDFKTLLETTEQRLKKLNGDLSKERERADTAEKDKAALGLAVKNCKGQLLAAQAELLAAQAENNDSHQRLSNIWAKLTDLTGSSDFSSARSAKKRTIDDDVDMDSQTESKKPKI